MKALPVAITILSLWFLGGCGGPRRDPAIGEAYVGPVTVKLREELTPKSPVVAALKHGEKVEILQRRRRFFKVRGPQGVEGWTDGAQLLTAEEMDELNRQTALAMKLPPLGKAFVYEPLNVHTRPNRQAPSFYQLQSKETAVVLTARLEPRVPYESPILKRSEPEQPKTPKRPPRKKVEPKIPPVPRAKAPGLPPGYDIISRQPPQDPEYLLKKQEREAARKSAVPIEEWSLVRIQDGRAGWVLARMLTMAIPDEVAQYAEGHRITSYYSLGETRHRDAVKHHWLWTTLASRNAPHHFDSFRVFVWSTARARYETAYIERNLTGYFPVTVGQERYHDGRGERNLPSFSVITRNKEGEIVRRTFVFAGHLVRLVRTEPWTLPPPFSLELTQTSASAPGAAAEARP